MFRLTLGWGLAAAIAGAATSVQASGAGDATQGRILAERQCSVCHAVTAQQRRPASSFADIATRWPPDMLAESLAEGIIVGQDGRHVPEFVFSPSQIDDLIAYLNSLAAAAE